MQGEADSWRAILEYLELSWEPEILTRFSAVNLHGRKGDPTGTRAYATLSSEPVDKWRSTICNPLRRAWCRRYLAWLGPDRLSAMGYDIDDLERALAATGHGREHIADDAARIAASVVREAAKAHLPRYTSRASTWHALLRPHPIGRPRTPDPGPPYS